MKFGLDEDQIEDLLNVRVGRVVDENVIKAIAVTVAANNVEIARFVQARIDAALEELIH
ncbi:MAG: hypothetical protein ABR548_14010 [Actinomycetota bacterium]|nr:hypothetical protein [Actinomycetota bacterium]